MDQEEHEVAAWVREAEQAEHGEQVRCRVDQGRHAGVQHGLRGLQEMGLVGLQECPAYMKGWGHCTGWGDLTEQPVTFPSGFSIANAPLPASFPQA